MPVQSLGAVALSILFLFGLLATVVLVACWREIVASAKSFYRELH